MASEKIDALELDITSKTSTENLDKLIDALGRLSKQLGNLKSKTVKVDIQQTGDASNQAAPKVEKLSGSFLTMAVRLTAVIALFRRLSGIISDGLSNSITYIKTLNMFNVSLGDYAENASKYAKTVRDAMGIDIAGWQSAQGVFQTLITGFGVSGDKAAYMSQQLTQLSYDIASFYNLTTEEAQNKVKSALSGRIEPIRKLGWDISQGKLVDIASNPANYGKTTYAVNQETGAIEANTVAVDDNTEHKIVNFNQLTQAEKVQLRYIALMTQVTQVQGNMAKTLKDPANQMRIFKEQTTMTARALGNIFIPALNQVLPYVTAFFKVFEEGFQRIAELFGFEIPDMSDRIGVANEVDYYDDIVEATGNAAKNAKKLKDYMIGIDELNVLRPDDGTSGGGSSGGQNSNISGLTTPGYDFLSKAIENSIKEAKEDIDRLFDDWKKHPLKLSAEIILTGMGEVGSGLWSLILGKSPEELAEDAQKYGRTVGEQFATQLKDNIGGLGADMWTSLLGMTPDELYLEAEAHGRTLAEQFCISFEENLGNIGSDIITLLFGEPEGLEERARDAGRTVAEQFLWEFANRLARGEVGTTSEFNKVEIDPRLKGVGSKDKYTNTSANEAYKRSKAYQEAEARRARLKNSPTNAYKVRRNTNGVYNNTAADEARKAGEAAIKAYAEGIDSQKDKVIKTVKGVYRSGLEEANGGGKGTTQYKNTAIEQAKRYADGLLSKVSDVRQAGTQLFKKGYDGATDDGKAPAKYEAASTSQATNYKEGLLSLKETIAQAGRELFNKGYSGATKGGDGKSEFSHAGAALASAFTDNLGSSYAKSEAYYSGSAVASRGNDGVRYNKPEFTQAGRNAGAGYIAGMDEYKSNAIQAGKTLAYNALKKLKEILGIKSPSREFAKAGMYSVLGYSNSIEEYSSLATNAVADMAKSAVQAVNASNSMFASSFSLPSTSNSGYGMGVANGMAMADLASNIYQAIVSGMATYGGNITGGDIRVIIDGKEVFKTVQAEARKRGIAISNGAFSI